MLIYRKLGFIEGNMYYKSSDNVILIDKDDKKYENLFKNFNITDDSLIEKFKNKNNYFDVFYLKSGNTKDTVIYYISHVMIDVDVEHIFCIANVNSEYKFVLLKSNYVEPLYFAKKYNGETLSSNARPVPVELAKNNWQGSIFKENLILKIDKEKLIIQENNNDNNKLILDYVTEKIEIPEDCNFSKSNSNIINSILMSFYNKKPCMLIKIDDKDQIVEI